MRASSIVLFLIVSRCLLSLFMLSIGFSVSKAPVSFLFGILMALSTPKSVPMLRGHPAVMRGTCFLCGGIADSCSGAVHTCSHDRCCYCRFCVQCRADANRRHALSANDVVIAGSVSSAGRSDRGFCSDDSFRPISKLVS